MSTAPTPALYALDDRQHATILAALRLYQSQRSGIVPAAIEIENIATNAGSLKPLTVKEIDALGESINHGGLHVMQLLPDLITMCAHGPKAYALIQQGGTSDELYIHAHESREIAEFDRLDCALDGAYGTSPVVEIPPILAALGEVFYETAEALVRAATDIECVDGCYTIQLGAGPEVPLEDGGSGPDEPVWRFDDRAEFDEAVGLAAQHDIEIVIGTGELPEGEECDTLDDFSDYLNMELEGRHE